MAYFINSKRRMQITLLKGLEKIFGNHAEIKLNGDRIDIKIISGYDKIEKRLTQEELDNGVIGGGLEAGLNGHVFKLSLEEVY